MGLHDDIVALLANADAHIAAQAETITALEVEITELEVVVAEQSVIITELQAALEECEAGTPPPPDFVPGVTEPLFNVVTETGNVGAKGPFTDYDGTITNGVIKLSSGGLYEGIRFPGVVELQNGEHLRNCLIEVPYDYIASDSIMACLRILNGNANTGAIIEDVTIANRAQRAMNGINGRNTDVHRTVVLGCIDGFVDSNSGGAPQNYGLRVHDSCVPEHAYWRAPAAPSEIHPSDPICHADGYQTASTLPSGMTNTTIEMYVSEKIGTGTPGASREQGNPYVPWSGSDYIGVDRDQMNDWRGENTKLTEPSQSKRSQAHRIMTAGSCAAAMVNRDNFLIEHCYFSGGLIPVNLLDSNLPTNMNVTVKDTEFWNDMRNGPGSRETDPTVKGYAIITKKGKTFTQSGNTWPDGSVVNPVYS